MKYKVLGALDLNGFSPILNKSHVKKYILLIGLRHAFENQQQLYREVRMGRNHR
jgi:hypothetical protein